ncbi:hypothetical protein A4X06_0g552 [Tilletia controversa]|uniref:Uncharacterized protein n=1 Tax=Tilletia controversa TaxID=13291 RepID=A0A8X7N014_9BASI|nr:hypothetical protein CF328_g539 [Tilletia controversa]KAE8255169.1 hypothetical protein A4X06_0g552 [Tilletia controversa]
MPGQDENAAHQHQQQQPPEYNQLRQDPTQLGPLPPVAVSAPTPAPTSDPSPPPSMEPHQAHLHPPSGDMPEPNQEVDAQAAQDAVEGFLAAWDPGCRDAVAAAAVATVAAEGSSSSTSPSAAAAGAPSSGAGTGVASYSTNGRFPKMVGGR